MDSQELRRGIASIGMTIDRGASRSADAARIDFREVAHIAGCYTTLDRPYLADDR
jgi:hypothetical protein